MNNKLITLLMCCAANFSVYPAFAQIQTCPGNINFSEGDLSFWSAKMGLVNGSGQSYPAPNNSISVIPEYSISTTGIQVITSPTRDPFGGFSTIPTINGYAYDYSVKLGSTATSWDLQSSNGRPGGFTRSITYIINVPAGPANVPYTMTYAYAMVLENGTHNSDQQPMFKATLSTHDGIITCASPKYYLPTFNNAGNNGGGSTGATLDSATALANGFTLSPVSFLSHTGRNRNGILLQDVWTKGWTEVTFDLSPYRGQQVTLAFEADNCVPGAHFAYAYVALRNSCAGLEVSGNKDACTNSTFNYSVPALADAIYNWTVPSGWAINSGANTNTINVTAGNTGGFITVHEINGCADLRDTIPVTALPPTVAGQVTRNATVCAGTNNTQLTLNGEKGNILNWISSIDGISWKDINNTDNNYTAQNLAATTQYRAIVQNGSGCKADTSAAATITVDSKTKGGILSPDKLNICAGQTMNNVITLSKNTGAVLNWQISNDNTNWNNRSPVKRDSAYNINAINKTTYYRTVVENGVCPADTSSIASITFTNEPFPSATIDPVTSSICYGDSIQLNADISIGDSYTWSPVNTLQNQGNGIITSLPFAVNALAKPALNTDYALTVNNAACPNPLIDTFHVAVAPQIKVFVGNDTSIVAGQPLQLNATVNDPSANMFRWTPATGLNFTDIYDPVATLSAETGDSITYLVKVASESGCYGEDNIKINIFKTGPDIFVPTAFTPNGDGLNDIIRPISIGIQQLIFFRIYNRWGQLVFSTSQIGKGWDGNMKGAQQSAGGFVYMVQGTDFTGKIISKKGSFILIR